jgi:hypothetical protein
MGTNTEYHVHEFETHDAGGNVYGVRLIEEILVTALPATREEIRVHGKQYYETDDGRGVKQVGPRKYEIPSRGVTVTITDPRGARCTVH